MKLKYSILWYDDDKSKLDPQLHYLLIEKIQSWGFEFDQPVYVSNSKKFMKHVESENFDLIVVDYNIKKDLVYGSDFIKKVRKLDLLTDVVFYSAGKPTDLWKEVAKKELEGVFLSHYRNIVDKVIKVAERSVKKIVDLNNMRGIVMAQVGDLDQDMKTLIRDGWSQIDDSKKIEIHQNFISRNEKSIQAKCENMREFKDSYTIDGMLALCDTSAAIWMLTKSLMKRHQCLCKDVSNIAQYQEEIIKPRNALAHGVPEQENGNNGQSVFKHHDYILTYSEEKALEIRQNLKKYQNLLEELKSKIATS